MEEITVTSVAIGLTVSKLITSPKPKEVFIFCETAQCRYFYHSGTPTSTSGIPLNPFDTLRIKGSVNLTNLLFIRTGATSAKLTVVYER